MIVIDASALVKIILKEPGWDAIVPHIIEGAVSIDLIAKESANAVGSRFREAGISIEQARLILTALMKMVRSAISIVNEIDYLEEASKIMLEHNTTIYDALYVALAKQTKLRLLTADRFQAKTAMSENVEAVLLE